MMHRDDLLPWFLFSLSLFSLASGLQAQTGDAGSKDWPRWRGSNFNDAASAKGVFSEPFELEKAWETEIGSGYSGISVLDGRIVTMGSMDGQDHVLALDASTGELLWKQRIAASYPGRDGAEDGPVSTPTLHGNTAYALGPYGNLMALDLESKSCRYWQSRQRICRGSIWTGGSTTHVRQVRGSTRSSSASAWSRTWNPCKQL